MANPSRIVTSQPRQPPPAWAARLLWIDCIGGAVVGAIVLLLSGWLSELEGLPRGVLLFTGAANLAYASLSFSLARRQARSRRLLTLLVMANLAWGVVCGGLLIAYHDAAKPLAYLHLGGEGIYVAVLGMLEWRYRAVLLGAADIRETGDKMGA